MRKNVIPLLKYQRSLETVDWPHTQDLRLILPFFVIFGSSPSHHFFFFSFTQCNSQAVRAKSFADENQLKGE